jgi:hypothetical protein
MEVCADDPACKPEASRLGPWRRFGARLGATLASFRNERF